MDRKFHKSVLSNGIRVITEHHPLARSVAIGIWVDVGTRDEKAHQVGISHLLEHMVFKGTKTRSAFQIAKCLECLGGELNAFTSREQTCFHALVLKDHWVEALDLLSDLVTSMKFTKKDFNLEKGVILQEIAMAEENPEEFVFDLFFEACFGRHPLGRSILGSIDTLAKMKMQEVYAQYKHEYQGSHLLISAAGNIDHSDFVAKTEELLGSKLRRKYSSKRVKPRWKNHRIIREKDTEQIHYLVGLPFPSFRGRDRFPGVIFNAALGGGMTSRLYQSVREKRGMAYTIYSTLNSFVDTGVLNIYAGIDSDKIEHLTDIIRRELGRIRKQGLKRSEIESFKTQTIGSLLLGSDDVDNRMNSIAVNELILGEYRSPESIVAQVQSVTSDDMHEFIDTWIRPEKMAGVLMGPELSKQEDWWKEVEF